MPHDRTQQQLLLNLMTSLTAAHRPACDLFVEYGKQYGSDNCYSTRMAAILHTLQNLMTDTASLLDENDGDYDS